MGILGTSSSLATDIEKATSEVNTQEKWGLIMDVCDKVINGAANAKECLKIIVKRLNHGDPHVVMQAITLLDACVSNCGKQFHLEVASRDFETEFKKLLQKSQPKVNMRLKLCLKKWAEADFKSDPQLNLIPSLYQKLRSEGHDFSDTSVTPKREPQLSKDPNVVSSQQEEEDIAKAIELSLKETKSGGAGSSGQSPKMTGSSSGGGGGSLYPTAMLASVPAAEPRKVRALYDFEAAEDNELTFQAGEIIMVLDDSDPNWWKGQNQRGEGLFPSNFVTSDLNAEPEEAGASGGKSKKSVQFSDEQKKEEEKGGGAEAEKDQMVLEINEEKIDRLLHLLHEADPEDPSADSEEMLQLEQMVNQMGPLIDTELERVDRKHAQLTQLSSDLVDAINLYHTLMREPDRSMMMGMGSAGYGMPGFPGQGPMPGMYGMPGMFNANMPPGMYAGMGGMPSGMPPYGMPHLRHDMAQMGLSGPSSLPPPPQAQQIPVSGASLGMQGHPQQMAHPPQQHMPNMSIPAQLPPGPQQPQPSTSAAVAPQQQQQPQHPMMNLGHMQSPLPQSYSNPISPPPIVSAVPTTLPNQPQQPVPVRLPQTQPQVPQTVPQQPGGAFQPYAAPVQPPTTSVHQQPPLNGHPVPTGATAPPPNHHPQHLAAGGQMPPQYQSAPLQQPPYMPPMGAGFPPNHHHPMLGHMMPPGTPLSINTATSSPQNIPIYQQQR